MAEHIHLDTGVLVPILWDRDPDQEAVCTAIIEDLRGQVRSYNKEVKMTKLALGECLSTYFEDVSADRVGVGHSPGHTDLISDLHEVLLELDVEFVSIPTECHQIASKLRRDDRELGYNDLYIAATAIADANSSYLISLDSDLITTRSINKISEQRAAEGHRSRPLQVDNQYSDN
jgi:predicted nucleic acid-binding protein